MSKISAKQTFDNGPKIQVTIHIDDGEIISSHLSLATKFCCQGANQQIYEWIEEYSNGVFKPLHLKYGTPFQTRVVQALQQVPFGATLSYKELANLAKTPNGARAIGNTMNKNPFPLFIPCHRVIQTNGKIGGFALNLEIKRRLLEFEAGKPAP